MGCGNIFSALCQHMTFMITFMWVHSWIGPMLLQYDYDLVNIKCPNQLVVVWL
jgi:hypothetical protein